MIIHQQSAHSLSAQHRSGQNRRPHQPLIEDEARHDEPGSERCSRRDRTSRRTQPQSVDRRASGDQTGWIDAEPGQHVQRVWRDAVAADLVPGKLSRVDQQHPRGRPNSQRTERRRASGRPGSDDRHVPSLDHNPTLPQQSLPPARLTHPPTPWRAGVKAATSVDRAGSIIFWLVPTSSAARRCGWQHFITERNARVFFGTVGALRRVQRYVCVGGSVGVQSCRHRQSWRGRHAADPRRA